MMLLTGRPPEAPYFSLAGYSLHAHQGVGNYQQVGRQPDEHILFSFQECDEQKEAPGQLAGCFLYAKKSHRWDTCREYQAEVRVA
jgi:hypothetical protein